MTVIHRLVVASCLAAALSPSLGAIGQPRGAVLGRLPAAPDPAARYVIYLHGRIIEEQGRRPTDARWGVYEYDAILGTLARDGATVVSEQRPSGTGIDAFAAHVADQVRDLLDAGVPPDHVSVVGFSKGGGIAIRTSVLVANPRVNFVFLAACGDGDFSGFDGRVWGRILSVYESSDDIGRSCRELFERSTGTGERSEIAIAVGEEHGTFYRPHAEWVGPVLRWIAASR
ncbi:MAG: alpha/beta hydrolase [Vicinamibacterales bacterium]